MVTKKKQIKLNNIRLDVRYKDIKNVHLSVYPPTGRVHISAPLRMNINTLRVFAISKLGWIKKQQNKFYNQDRESPRNFISRESHYFFGKRYLLKVMQHKAPAIVDLKHDIMELYIRPNTGVNKKRKILDEWYRKRLKEFVPQIIANYEKQIKVKVEDFGIKKMRTKWGTCNRDAKRIWINLELAKKPKHFTEYIVVHEMVHLLEHIHNKRFVAYMDKFVPNWRLYKEELNQLALGHIKWNY